MIPEVSHVTIGKVLDQHKVTTAYPVRSPSYNML